MYGLNDDDQNIESIKNELEEVKKMNVYANERIENYENKNKILNKKLSE